MQGLGGRQRRRLKHCSTEFLKIPYKVSLHTHFYRFLQTVLQFFLPVNVFAQEMVPYHLQDFHRTANNIKYLSHTFSLTLKVVPKQYNSLLFHKGRENWGERWERNRTPCQPCQHRLKIHQCQPSASENRQV